MRARQNRATQIAAAAASLLLFGLISLTASRLSSPTSRPVISSRRQPRQHQSGRQLAAAGEATQSYTTLDHIPETLVGDLECSLTAAEFRGKVLVSGQHHKKGEAAHCRQACRENPDCTTWLWCDDVKTCWDGHTEYLPHFGCQLQWEPRRPWGQPPEGELIAKPSTFASGYVKRRNAGQQTFVRQHSSPSTSMIIATMMHPLNECKDAHAEEMIQLALMSRRDYAQWHSYELHIATQHVDWGIAENAHGAWNKVAFIKKLLDTTAVADAEWILYMEADTLFDAPGFTLPFEFYAGRDIILLGNPATLRAGDPKGVDFGVLLVRNSERSKQLFAELVNKSEHFQDSSQVDVAAQALTHIINDNPRNYLSLMHFEKDFCLDCDWRRIDLNASDKVEITKVWGEENKRWKLFITRFFDCELCHGEGMQPDQLPKCHASMREHFAFASCRIHRFVDSVHREKEQGVPLQHLGEIVNVQGFDIDSWSRPEPVTNEELQKVQTHSAHSCYEWCLGDERCSFWVFCHSRSGCDDSGVFDGRFPYESCTLMRHPQGVSPYNWERGPQASTFASGYISERQHSKKAKKWADENLVALTGIPTDACNTPWGDHLISLAVQNKQDWARLHGHELHLMAASTDLRIRPGAWQKIASLRQALASIPRERAEWIIWIDMDVILGDIAFTFPLTKQQYVGKDFVVWGNVDAVHAGDTYNGLNGGVMLFRNTDWSRNLLDMASQFGQFPANMSTEQVLQKALPTYDIGMFEQNAMVYLLMQHEHLLYKTYFEHSYCFNCWFKDLDSPKIIPPAFVVHFAGCQLCSGLHTERVGECAAIFVRLYAEAFARLVSAAIMQGL